MNRTTKRNEKPEPEAYIGVKVPQSLKEEAVAMGKRKDRTMSQLVRAALRNLVDNEGRENSAL